jgi:hypothetical protein
MTSAPPLRPDSRIRIAPSVYARAFGAEIILLEFHRGEYFGLDPIGAEVWRLLEAGSTLAAAADSLVARYEVSREDALSDIVSLVGDMRENELVTPETDTSAGEVR